VTQPDKDWNRLAALLEDRLAERDRDEALAHLSVSDEDAGDFADAAATLRELEEEDGVVITPRADAEEYDSDVPALVGADVDADAGAKVIPLRPPSTARTWRRPPARWLALAAVIVGVLVVLPVTRFGGGRDPSQYAALLENEEEGLPEGWMDQRPPWRVTRGTGSPLIDNTRAAQLGAGQTDLELAVAGGQSGEIQLLAGRMAQLLDDVPAAGSAASLYRDIGARAGEPREQLATSVDEAGEYVTDLVEADYFNLGSWAEAARIAARQRDAEFFRARASRRMLDRTASMSSLNEYARTSAEAIRAAVPREGQPDWASLEPHTKQLLGSIGGGSPDDWGGVIPRP